ncbi:MAG TPA: ATP-binding protein [Nitrososphaeria archaeon]|nr:ATP-binding protein [Nitrososphaeria archaeon]
MMSKFVRSTIGDLLGSFGWKLVIKPYEKKIEFQKEFDNIVVSLPYISLSDTIQRIIFYLTAILSNKDSVIVFEEPEAHAFPYYTKFLAEQIALDDRGNQYFISTHNPYFLLSVIEKSKMDVSVFITYLEEGETKVKQLVGKKLEQLLEYDVDIFFNLESLIEGSS